MTQNTDFFLRKRAIWPRMFLLLSRLACAFALISCFGFSAASGKEVSVGLRAEAEGMILGPDVESVRTTGYTEVGKGGALYVFAGTVVPQYQPRGEKMQDRPSSHYLVGKANGGDRRYYLLAEERPDVLQFGAKPDSGFDNTQPFNDALAYGKGAFVPRGRYEIQGTILAREDATVLYGTGPGGNNTGGSELFFGPGEGDCIQFGDGVNQLRWGKLSRLTIDAKARTGGNAVFAFFNFQLVLEELRINNPYNGIRLFRGLGFMIRDVVMSRIRAGNGTADGPTEIGYGLKFGGAPELYEKETGTKVKRDTHVLYVENLSFGSAKLETDPTNWTVGLWCAENAASVNGATLKNQNVRYGVYISRAKHVDPSDRHMVPEGFRLVPATWTDSAGAKGRAGKTYAYGSTEYPIEPGTVPDLNGRFQDLTLFYLGGDYLGGEYVYNDEGSGVAIYNPHFMRSYQGNCVYMGPESRDMSIYGGQVIGAYKNGLEMNGKRWHISGVQIYRPSLDGKNREAHKGKYSAIKVGATSVGGDVINCKIGNEPPGSPNRGGSTARFGIDIAAGARGTWYHGNRFDGCLEANVNNEAGEETQAGTNRMNAVGD
jgi:hypothetical protein